MDSLEEGKKKFLKEYNFYKEYDDIYGFTMMIYPYSSRYILKGNVHFEFLYNGNGRYYESWFNSKLLTTKIGRKILANKIHNYIKDIIRKKSRK